MQKVGVLFFALLACALVRADDSDSSGLRLHQYNSLVDSVNQAMRYETGVVQMSNGVAQLVIPQGFKYLNPAQSQYILTQLWGHAPQPDIVGMLFPANGGPFADSTYAFVINWKAMGYVKDDNARQIDSDQMLQHLQTEEAEENARRREMGFPAVHVLGWVQKPLYDNRHNALYWAKEVQSGKNKTLSYDICILGRKGILSMNAVGNMGLVKPDLNKVLEMAVFNAGNRHADFDPTVDQVATWTIASLVTGKILDKPGFVAFLQKSMHLVVVLLVAVGASIVQYVKRQKQSPTLAVN